MTLSSLAPSLRKPTDRILTKHVQFPDFPKRCAEFLDAKSINDGIDGRVTVRENDGDVNEEHWLITGRTKEGDTVEDVKWQPADCKEEKNKGQRLGQLELLAKVTAGVCVASCHLQRDKEEDHQRTNVTLVQSVHIKSVLIFWLQHIKQSPTHEEVLTFLLSCLWIM